MLEALVVGIRRPLDVLFQAPKNGLLRLMKLATNHRQHEAGNDFGRHEEALRYDARFVRPFGFEAETGAPVRHHSRESRSVLLDRPSDLASLVVGGAAFLSRGRLLSHLHIALADRTESVLARHVRQEGMPLGVGCWIL